MRNLSVPVLSLCAALLAAFAPASAPAEEVDVELLLMVDVSRSMSPGELELQRRGYAEALASDEVIAAIRSGFLGNVAMAYVEWAGSGLQRVIVDWRVLRTRADAEAFAQELERYYPASMRRTSIAGALNFGRRMFDDNGFDGLRRVIDISGDRAEQPGRRRDPGPRRGAA